VTSRVVVSRLLRSFDVTGWVTAAKSKRLSLYELVVSHKEGWDPVNLWRVRYLGVNAILLTIEQLVLVSMIPEVFL
jgi:hypothetical protein